MRSNQTQGESASFPGWFGQSPHGNPGAGVATVLVSKGKGWIFWGNWGSGNISFYFAVEGSSRPSSRFVLSRSYRTAGIREFRLLHQGGLDFSAGGLFQIVDWKKFHTELSIF
jgi:hypothetical protein